MKSCMAWGLEVEDGWYDLIDRLCEDIMKEKPAEDFCASQVKEKFGGLRFYTWGGSDRIDDLISAAQAESYKICEVCGSREDVTSEGSWIKTLCRDCRKD